MKIIINADDFANSLNMSDIIMRCAKDGILNSTSIMINSPYLDESILKLENANIRTSLHLNIAEGRPISSQNELNYLLQDGKFSKSFEKVVLGYYFGTKQKREIIKNDIKAEFKNQILLYSKKLHTKEINLDSHQHYHTIPFIVDILIELKKELDLDISYVRVPKEPFFIDLSSIENIKNYLGLNIIKHILLNFFSKGLIKKLKRYGIKHNDAFVGVLFTGNVTFNSIKKAIKKINTSKCVEILLHPGYLSLEENSKYKDDKFKQFYINKGRKKEMQVLLSQEFRYFIETREKDANSD